MKIFPTGATGYVGAAIAATLIRAKHERIVLAAGGAVIRPGMIHGGDAFLFAHPLFIGNGSNRWPLVHRDDVAEL